MPNMDGLMELYSEATSDESDTELLINAIQNAKEYHNNVIEYGLSPKAEQIEQQRIVTLRDAINALVQQFRVAINPVLEELPREVVINCEAFEYYTMRLSRCSTLRKI